MHIKGENVQENSEIWITWLVLESDGLGKGCDVLLMTRLVKIFLFLVGTRGQHLQRIVSAKRPTVVRLAEQSLLLSSSTAIPCKRERQGWMEESRMVPRYWL